MVTAGAPAAVSALKERRVRRPEAGRGHDVRDNHHMVHVNVEELRRYVRRVDERWRIDSAYAGGARVDEARGVTAERERGPEWVVVLVSQAFDGVPWLERVHQAGSLWDAAEMGDPVEVHCYTPMELQRKVDQIPRVRDVARDGIDLLAAPPAA